VSVVHTHRLSIRVALGASLVFSSLALVGCAKRAEVSVASPEAPTPAPPQPQPKPKPKPPSNDGKGTGGFDPIGGFLGTTPAPGSPAEQTLLQKHKTALVGTWTADLGNGVTEERVYTAMGTFTAKLTGAAPASAAGKYTVQGLVGTKGLKIQLDSGNGPRTITATFDDDELQHPTLQPGVTGTFRKK
jgi:hypothetical protein